MYCVEWKTRNAKPARKSRDDNKPATGLNVNPVQSKEMKNYTIIYIPLYVINTLNEACQREKSDINSVPRQI